MINNKILNSKERARLRGEANSLNVIITVGKAGVTPEVVKMVDEALTARELIKVGLLDNTDIPVEDAAQMLSERSRSQIVQIIGRKIILYKKNINTNTTAKNTKSVKGNIGEKRRLR